MGWKSGAAVDVCPEVISNFISWGGKLPFVSKRGWLCGCLEDGFSPNVQTSFVVNNSRLQSIINRFGAAEDDSHLWVKERRQWAATRSGSLPISFLSHLLWPMGESPLWHNLVWPLMLSHSSLKGIVLPKILSLFMKNAGNQKVLAPIDYHCIFSHIINVDGNQNCLV